MEGHVYFTNEDEMIECSHCGLLRETIEALDTPDDRWVLEDTNSTDKLAEQIKDLTYPYDLSIKEDALLQKDILVFADQISKVAKEEVIKEIKKNWIISPSLHLKDGEKAYIVTDNILDNLAKESK